MNIMVRSALVLLFACTFAFGLSGPALTSAQEAKIICNVDGTPYQITQSMCDELGGTNIADPMSGDTGDNTGNQTSGSTLSECPGVGDASDMMGQALVKVSTEPCAFTYRTVPNSFEAVCPAGICTVHMAQDDRVVVFAGSGQTFNGEGVTWRPLLNDTCMVFAGETQNGKISDPPFDVFVDEDADCANADDHEVNLSDYVTGGNTGTVSTDDDATTACSLSKEDLTAAFGGTGWTPVDQNTGSQNQDGSSLTATTVPDGYWINTEWGTVAAGGQIPPGTSRVTVYCAG